MRIVVHHTAYYDWEPVPPDATVTPEDISAGLARPSPRGGGHLMRVTKQAAGGGTHTTVTVSERDIIHRLLHSMHPAQGRLTITRKEAVSQILAALVMPHHAHPKWVTDVEVEDDGPDEALFAEIVQPFTTIGRGGSTSEMVIDPADYDAVRAAYLAADAPESHATHLKARFGVGRAA